MKALPAYFTSAHRDINLALLGKTLDIGALSMVEPMVRELATLPSPDSEGLSALYPSYDGEHLWRGLALPPEDLEIFMEQHREGEVVTYPTFTSTTVISPSQTRYGYGNRPLQLRIKHLKPTKAKHVDPYKKSKDEGELLFAPNSSFRVVSRTVTSTIPSVKPLRKVFGSTSEGLGIANLTLGEMIQDRSLEDLLSSEDYCWFRALLKKGAIPLERCSENATVGELYSPSKLKGGKAAFYYAAAQCLKSEELEPYSVRIHLEEI